MTCNVTGTAISPNGQIKPGAKITFRRAQLDVVSQVGSFVIPDDYIIQTALNGTVNFNILPGVYDATTVAVGGHTVAFRVSVPNEPAADFADLLNASYVEIPPASVTQAQQARDAAIAARDVAVAARDEALLYDGPKVDTFAELASVTPTQLAVGEYIRVIETGAVYQRVSTGGDLDYTGSGGVRLAEAGTSYTTRQRFVNAIARGELSGLINGTTVTAGGLEFVRASGATAISDLPGWLPVGSFTPLHWGAVGDGVADDGAAINASLAAYKVAVEAEPDQLGNLIYSGLGLTYRTTVSINATGISTWGWCIRDITIVGECAGKCVLDTIGSRGGVLREVTVYGDRDAMPSVGIQAARSTGGQEAFCDNMLWDSVHIRGYFSVVARWCYGQETTTYLHCSAWNSNPNGSAAFHVGHSAFDWGSTAAPLMQSDYLTPITGATSFINDTYITDDCRYLPTGNIASISAITNANPMVVTAEGHPFEIGDTVTLAYVGGMTQANGIVAQVTAKTSSTITLGSVDSTAFSTFTSGGSVVKAQTKPSMVIGRLRQHHFQTCYVVSYGYDHIHVVMPDTENINDLQMGYLFEGAGAENCVKFRTGGVGRSIVGFNLNTYSVHSNFAVVGSDGSSSIRVAMHDAKISVLSVSNGETPRIFDDEAKFAAFATNIVTYSSSRIDVGLFAAFTGSVHGTNDGLTKHYFTDILANDDLGFTSGRGAGGTVTQATSKATAITLNRRTGNITTAADALGAGAPVNFRLNNSMIGDDSVVILNMRLPTGKYRAEIIGSASGYADIRLTNLTGGSLSEAVTMGFAVITGSRT